MEMGNDNQPGKDRSWQFLCAVVGVKQKKKFGIANVNRGGGEILPNLIRSKKVSLTDRKYEKGKII
jgi:hypothetical protein